MLEKIDRFVQVARSSPRFQNVISQRSAPAKESEVTALADLLAKVGMDDAARAPLLEFYGLHDGLTLRWELAELTHPDYITAGNTSITPLAPFLAKLARAREGLIPFDTTSDLRQVMIRVRGARPELRYFDADSGKDHPLDMDFARYFRLLDECRALRPWQEILIEAKSFKLEPVLRRKFFADLKLLFEDADPRLFGATRS